MGVFVIKQMVGSDFVVVIYDVVYVVKVRNVDVLICDMVGCF